MGGPDDAVPAPCGMVCGGKVCLHEPGQRSLKDLRQEERRLERRARLLTLLEPKLRPMESSDDRAVATANTFPPSVPAPPQRGSSPPEQDSAPNMLFFSFALFDAKYL